MTLIASAETARANRRRGSAPDGVTFWHTLYLGTTRYNMAPGTPEPAPDALFPMAFLVEQDPGSTAQRALPPAGSVPARGRRPRHAGPA